MSKEWFANIDPLYPTYGKQVAIARQSELFTNDLAVEQGWLRYIAHIKATSHFGKYAAFSFGDPNDHENKAYHLSFGSAKQNELLHARWRPKRKSLVSFADPAHPFRYQGEGKPYLQKLFMEQAHALLRTGGRIGFIVPSGLYSDKGSATLRTLFLDHCRWEWCFGFENREKIFDIDSRFKFLAMIVEKGGKTNAIHTAFMRRHVDDWDQHAEAIALDYPRELVTKLSPFSTALVEIRDPRDVVILDRMYSRGVLLGDQSERGWGLRFQQGDFNMASDSKLFPPLPKWEAKGYRPDEYGHWLKGDWRPVTSFGSAFSILDHNAPAHERASTITTRPGLLLCRDGISAIRIEDIEDVAVPLYEGRMIGQFDYSQKGWVSGKARTAVWRDIPWNDKQIEPQYLMGFEHLHESRMAAHLKAIEKADGKHEAARELQRLNQPEPWLNWWRTHSFKLAFMDICSATNERTMYASAMDFAPCGHSAPLLHCGNHTRTLAAIGLANSIGLDSILRLRVGGLHLTWHYLEEASIPAPSSIPLAAEQSFAGLALPGTRFAPWWISIRPVMGGSAWQRLWAITPAERLRRRVISDAIVFQLYSLEAADLPWLLVDCDHPSSDANSNEFSRRLDPKGFWRMDKEKDPELRHTVLAQVAYADLCAQGLDAFLTGPDGDGWQLPETLRLADYGLGHDDRALAPQPVASRLGPRFLDWQLAKDPAESWAECEAHAAQLDALWQHARQLAGSSQDDTSIFVSEDPATYQVSSAPARSVTNQLDLKL
jgi:hypothetical protein